MIVRFFSDPFFLYSANCINLTNKHWEEITRTQKRSSRGQILRRLGPC